MISTLHLQVSAGGSTRTLYATHIKENRSRGEAELGGAATLFMLELWRQDATAATPGGHTKPEPTTPVSRHVIPRDKLCVLRGSGPGLCTYTARQRVP